MNRHYQQLDADMLALVTSLAGVLNDQEVQEVRQFIDVGEYGVAFETLCAIIKDERKVISEPIAVQVARLAHQMSIDDDYWRDIARAADIETKLREFLARKGMPVVGTSERALRREDALKRVDALSRGRAAILGGDVHYVRGIGLESAYADWHVERSEGESESEYLARSCERAREYIRTFPERPGNEPAFVLVTSAAPEGTRILTEEQTLLLQDVLEKRMPGEAHMVHHAVQGTLTHQERERICTAIAEEFAESSIDEDPEQASRGPELEELWDEINRPNLR